MYTIEEYDKEKSKVLKYVLYKKRSKKEVQNKFYNAIENEMLHDIIEELEENGYIDDNNYIERAINEFMALNNLSLKEVRYKLMSKGIPNDLIEDYINSHDEEMENYETKSAKTIIMKKQNQMDEEAIIQYLLDAYYKPGDSIRKYYSLQCYAGAIYNAYATWGKNNHDISAQELSELIHEYFVNKNGDSIQ